MTDQKTHLQSIGRVVAGVVDVQQTMTLQFDALSKGLESLKLEHQSGIAQLREDIRRSDDRATKQLADLNNLHNKEMERLHQIIHTLLIRDTAPPMNVAIPQLQPQQQQQLQQAIFLQRQMEMAQAQAHAQNQALSNLIASSAAMKPMAPANTPLIPASQPVLATPTQQIKPQIPIGQAQPISFAQKPATSEVTISSNSTQPAAVKPLFPVAAPTPAPAVVPAVVEKPKATVTAPATTTPAAPTGFSFGTSSLFGKKPESATVVPTVPKTPVTTTKEEDEESDEDYEPEANFEPVIPLPDLVEVKTGEEDEEVVFNNRSKLYIFSNDTSEWKERGTGELKVLLNKETKKYRVVMRRDQVLKVCANFPIVGSMSIQPMRASEKAYTWFCEDFSEDEPAHVKLSARFANVDIATEFKNLFEKAVAAHKSGATIDKEIKPAEVKKEIKKEAKEEVVIPSNNKENGFGEQFKLKAGTWECPGCYLKWKDEETQCITCGTNKDGSVGEKSIFSKPSILQPAPGTPKVQFGFGASAPAKESPAPAAAAFGASLNGSPSTAKTSIFGGGSTPKGSMFGGTTTAANTSSPFSFNTAQSAAAPSSAKPTFNFKTASPATSSQGNALFGGSEKVDTGSTAPRFSFNKPSESSIPKPNFSFSNPPASSKSETEEKKEIDAPKGSFFGGFSGGNETLASMAAKAKGAGTSIFDTDKAEKARAELASQKKTSVFGSKTSIPSASTAQKDEEDEGEYEPEVNFAPVIPLPDLVEVRTGEEDEEVVFSARCKLYKYFADLQENKERGVGDIKVLKSNDNKYRIVMRRDQVHKICANFRIEKSMKLNPKGNLPQVLTFMCQDYSDDVQNPDPAIFTAKFKDESIANGFKKAVQDAQATM